jgi:hypothetical protein
VDTKYLKGGLICDNKKAWYDFVFNLSTRKLGAFVIM